MCVCVGLCVCVRGMYVLYHDNYGTRRDHLPGTHDGRVTHMRRCCVTYWYEAIWCLTKRTASQFGWRKMTWGVGTSNGKGAQKTRPAVQKALSVQRQIRQLHPEARGVFVWTAEYSARCRPAWCVEKLLARTMRGEAVPPTEAANCMCRMSCDVGCRMV
eukprot:COSAG01_NODE_6871_length_3463_cov_17.354637_3_plen_159_part_00